VHFQFQGDLQGKQFTLSQSASCRIGLNISFHTWPFVQSQLWKGGRNDKNNVDSALKARNLSLLQNPEGNLMLEYTFFDLEKKKISPYVFGGIAVFHFNLLPMIRWAINLSETAEHEGGLHNIRAESHTILLSLLFRWRGIKFRISSIPY